MAEEFRQRLDNDIGKLVENFGGLIKTSRIRDKTNTTRESFQTSVYATSLVQAAESLLKLTSELKMSVTLNDFEGIAQSLEASSSNLEESCDNVDESMKQLNMDISVALYELETHYYQSLYREDPDKLNIIP